MFSIGTPKGREMVTHPADYTTAGRQRWESKDPTNWKRTFGHDRRVERGRSKYVIRDGVLVKVQ